MQNCWGTAKKKTKHKKAGGRSRRSSVSDEAEEMWRTDECASWFAKQLQKPDNTRVLLDEKSEPVEELKEKLRAWMGGSGRGPRPRPDAAVVAQAIAAAPEAEARRAQGAKGGCTHPQCRKGKDKQRKVFKGLGSEDQARACCGHGAEQVAWGLGGR